MQILLLYKGQTKGNGYLSSSSYMTRLMLYDNREANLLFVILPQAKCPS